MSNELVEQRNFKMDFEPAVLEINNYDEMKDLVEDYSNKYKGLVFTKDEKSGTTKARSELLALRNAIDDERKNVKRIYNEPLEEFENKVKTLTSMIDEPLEDIRGGLKEIDEAERAERQEALNAYLSKKLADEGINVDDIEESPRWLNKGMWTDKLEPRKELVQDVNKTIKEAVKEKEHHEMQVKVLTEFCKAQDIDPAGWVSQLEHRDAMEVIDLINLDKQRKERLAKEQEEKKKEFEAHQEKQQQTMQEAEEWIKDEEEKLAKEQTKDTELITNTIKVTGTVKQLSMLNQFLVENAIAVEAVPEVDKDALPF